MANKKINWKKYNRELINRGSITLWFNPNDTASWYAQNEARRGRPFKYSLIAIEILIMIKVRFGMPLRAIQGFAESLFGLVDKNIDVPNYTTLSRRMGSIEVNLTDELEEGGELDVVIDSSGLKVYGEGEWKVKIHGRQKHRTWRKIHLAVNPKNNKILTAALSTNDFKDSDLFQDLLEDIDNFSTVAADGAYDANHCFDYVEGRKASAIIPPRKNAKISKRGSQKQRDKNIRSIRASGRKNWKVEKGYHKRSLSETAVWRIKSLSGDKLRSRKFENQATEALMKCKIVNKMKTPKIL